MEIGAREVGQGTLRLAKGEETARVAHRTTSVSCYAIGPSNRGTPTRCLKRYVAREIYRELLPRAALAAAADNHRSITRANGCAVRTPVPLSTDGTFWLAAAHWRASRSNGPATPGSALRGSMDIVRGAAIGGDVLLPETWQAPPRR